jgi:hypothetical protein
MATKAKFDKELKLQAKAYHNKLTKEIVKEWGNHALNDLEVTKIGKILLGSKYKNTYPQDKTPFTNSSKYFIINVDYLGFSGSHWCAVFQDQNKNMYMYDSFARPSRNLLPYIYKNAKDKGFKLIDVNKKTDQCQKTNICGPLSISWLKSVEKFGIDSARHI